MTRNRWRRYLAPLGTLLAVAGCVKSTGRRPDSAADDEARGYQPNGPLLTGARIEGKSLASVTLATVTLADGTLLHGVTLEGTALAGGPHRGVDFAGALLDGTKLDGTPVHLHLDDIAGASDDRSGELLLYHVSYQTAPGNPWISLCSAAPDAAHPGVATAGAGTSELRALPIAGRWDYHIGHSGDGGRLSTVNTELTFACQGSALAQCLLLGYRPWKNVAATVKGTETHVPLGPLLAACVRALRADYCGDGESLTREGEVLSLHDAIGIQKDVSSWPLEAVWDAEGARCVGRTRDRAGVPTRRGPGETAIIDFITHRCPARWGKSGSACAAVDQADPTLIFTEWFSSDPSLRDPPAQP